LEHGDGADQAKLLEIAADLAPERWTLRPGDREESLPLVNQHGVPTGATCPRWLCHVLALRHRCVHVLLIWKSPKLGNLLLLQIRDWNKDDSAGQLDLSVGGHVSRTESDAAGRAALDEMFEELNLELSDLETDLQFIGGYAFDECRPDELFFNWEWRDLYIGRLNVESITRIGFTDGEVAGIVLVPVVHAIVGIPMMSISHSDLMPIRSERSDAGLFQCETVIGIRQEFC
jgi:8-oxo-dGTP pyrophosphatase MutT (NUDIX family)